MSMEPGDVIVIEGVRLDELLSYLTLNGRPLLRKPYRLAVALDEGGAKFKVDQQTWTPALGRPLAEEGQQHVSLRGKTPTDIVREVLEESGDVRDA